MDKKRQDYAINIGSCNFENIRFELIEPLTESIYSEYLDKYGDKIIHHQGIAVGDYNLCLDQPEL